MLETDTAGFVKQPLKLINGSVQRRNRMSMSVTASSIRLSTTDAVERALITWYKGTRRVRFPDGEVFQDGIGLYSSSRVVFSRGLSMNPIWSFGRKSAAATPYGVHAEDRRSRRLNSS